MRAAQCRQGIQARNGGVVAVVGVGGLAEAAAGAIGGVDVGVVPDLGEGPAEPQPKQPALVVLWHGPSSPGPLNYGATG